MVFLLMQLWNPAHPDYGSFVSYGHSDIMNHNYKACGRVSEEHAQLLAAAGGSVWRSS